MKTLQRMSARGWRRLATSVTGLFKTSKALRIGVAGQFKLEDILFVVMNNDFITIIGRVIFTGTGIITLGYIFLDTSQKRTVKTQIGSSVRFLRSLSIGLWISGDYWVAPLIGHEEKFIHERSARYIVEGCLKNGGLYVKLGQGLAALNHILPREYIETLTILQVSIFLEDI